MPVENGPDLIANSKREAEMMAAARKPYADLIMKLEQERYDLAEQLVKKQDVIDELRSRHSYIAIACIGQRGKFADRVKHLAMNALKVS